MSEEYEIEVDGEKFQVKIDTNADTYVVTVNNRAFTIKLPDSQSNNMPRKRGTKSNIKSGVISSSIPGKVVTIEVELGSKVKEGDVCMILEAMKMQNEINAPISGIVSEINCTAGSSIEANLPLIIIKPEDN